MNFRVLFLIMVFCIGVLPNHLSAQSGISAKLIKSDEIKYNVEAPWYPGGDEAFYTYLSNNIRYPYILVQIEMEGDIDIDFTIDKDGIVRDITIVRGFDPLADDEVIRVLKAMPKWKPAVLNHVAKDIQLKLNVTFSLTEDLQNKAAEMKEKGAKSDDYVELKEGLNSELPNDSLIEKPDSQIEKLPADTLNRTPEFPGGQEALNAYLRENMKYPKRAIELKIEGRVVFNLEISVEGEISKIWIYKSLYRDCDEEAYYLIKKMPKWKPGMKDGQPAAMRVILPVPFILPK